MNTQNSSTPLWLELKTEYIDDNFEALLPYLKSNCSVNSKEDSFLATTIDLLARRVEGIIKEVGTRELYRDEEEMKDLRCKNVRMLGAYCLARPDAGNLHTVAMAMLCELKAVTPKLSSSLMMRMMECVKHSYIHEIGVCWDDIIDFHREIFANKLLKYMRLSDEMIKPMVFAGNGTLVANAKGLFMTPEAFKDALKRVENGSESLETEIGLSVKTSSDYKLKKKDSDSVEAIVEFAEDIVNMQKRVTNNTSAIKKKVYANNDNVVVRVTNIGYDGTIHVITTDNVYEAIEGYIFFDRPSIMYYYSDTLYHDFKVGDYLSVTINNALKGTFTLTNQFIEFMVEDCKNNFGYNEALCQLIDVNVKKNILTWLTCQGVAVYTKNTLELQDKKDQKFVYIDITEYGSGKAYGKICGEFNRNADPADAEDRFDEKEVRHECVRAFIDSTPAPIYTPQNVQKTLPVDLVRIIIRALFVSQKSLLRPTEKLRYLSLAMMLAVMLNEETTESYLRFVITYLRQIVMFVDTDNISDVNLKVAPAFEKEDSVLVRRGVIQILGEYGRKQYSEELADCIENFQDEHPILATLARLVQTANTMRDVLSTATINVIKREIIRTLSLETEDDADLDSGRTFLGVESGTMEFKTSFVYPAGNNMQPEPNKQMHNVCRGLCGFLNSSTGGILYLGVNDQGYVTGLDNDMKYLHIQSIDGYQRYVQDNVKNLLGLDSMAYIRMEPTEDNQIIAIHVEPHPYRVVELEDKAYLRVNAESREMPENMRLELIDRKMLRNKEKAAAISKLQHAAQQKKVVVLHDYSSSNSLSVQDRTVEAFEIRVDVGLVSCYDIDKKAMRVFMLSRIGYVEVTNKPWTHTDDHKAMKVDAFHFTGDTPINVSLKLDIMSKNLLVEEFPLAKADLAQDKANPEVWYLNTIVYNIYGIGRFYIGLANHIEILEGEELRDYVRQYKKDFLDNI